MWTQEALNAYLAGWIESDGSIGISKNGIRAKTFRIRVSIYNNNESVLSFIQDNFGGTIHKRDCQGRLAKRPQYTLVWQAKTGVELLNNILPYLIGKRRQAELAIEMYEENKKYGFNGHANREWQISYYEQMKELNSAYRGG